VLPECLKMCVGVFTGVVLKEIPREVPVGGDNDGEKRLAVTHKFSDFTYWNLDLTPSADDKIMHAMKWIDIAKVVCPRDKAFSVNFYRAVLIRLQK